MKLNFSLKQSWTLIVLFAVFTPVLSVLFWYGLTTYQFQLNSSLTLERQANMLLRNQIESEINRFKTLSRNKSDPLSLLIGENKNIKDINKLLRAIVEREPAIHEAIILSPEKDVIAVFDNVTGLSFDRLLTSNEKHSTKLHWGLDGDHEHPEIVIPSSGREYIGLPEKHDGHIHFSMATPIGSPVKAILILVIDLNGLWSTHIEKYEHGVGVEKTRDYILDRRGTLLTEIDDSKFKTGDLMTHLAITRAALINGQWQADTSYIGVTNQPVFGTLTTIPSLGWSLISEVIVSEITQPIWTSLLQILLATLLGVMLFVWFVLRLANKTLEPIQHACDAIDLVAQGEYKTSLNLTGIRELDTMTSGINRMTKAREKAESELIGKEQEQRQMLNSMVNAVISIDEDGVILSFNNAAKELFGYNFHEVIGASINQLMPEPYSSKHTGYLQHYLKTGEENIIGFNRDVEGLHKNKDTFPLRLFVAELPKGTNGKRRFIGSCIDLTQIKQQEEQLRRSQKMDALGQLTGGIAHDYNNMLGITMGYARLLERALGEDPKLANYAHEIHRASERGAKLTKKLLSFSRKKGSDDEVLNLNTVLQGEQHMLDKVLTARIDLVVNLADDLWPIYVDAGELEDVILNISINAMHAIDGHGQVTIQTKNEHINEFDTQSLNLSSGAYVSLSITDTGSGMDESTRERIFEPFYSTKGDQGTGLGLSQVYGFVQRSGGAIKVYSEPGHGTRFTIYFPRHYSINDDKKSGKEENNEIIGGYETILLVDDEAALLTLNSELLGQQGYKAICANSAQQALQILEHEHVDVLLTDVIMPKMDGYQLAAAVKEKYPDVKIQLASGFSDNYNSELVDQTLLRNLLNKPFNSQRLLERIRALLDAEEIHQ